MSALFWLVGLLLLVAVLFLLALLKPTKINAHKADKPANKTTTTPLISPALQQLLDSLTKLLPEFTLNAKSGEQQRIIVSCKNLQCAIVVLSNHTAQRLMGQTLIINTKGNPNELSHIAQNIRQHFDNIYQAG
ncbi:MAG: hypothetical protein Q4A69_04900 [Moraxella sp.]|nr:hypothetical protein [Moraxella sp.]